MARVKKWKTRNSIFWGIVFIGAAAFLILGALGIDLGYGVTAWRIVLGVLCLAWLVDRIVELQFSHTVFPIAFLFLIFEPTIAHLVGSESSDLISNWIVLLAALLLTIGLKILLPKRIGGRTYSVERTGSALYLDGSELESATISDHVGSTNVYISNTDAYIGGGTINITDNVGSIKLHIPSTWNVILQHSDNLGRVSITEQKDGVYEHSINVNVYENVGSVNVVFD